MRLVGLTGQIGAGKTTVLRMLREKGLATIDADDIVLSEIYGDSNGRVYQQIAASFPEALEDGKIDRKTLAQIVFADDNKRKRLEALVHPAVMLSIMLKLFSHWIRGHLVVILDIPLLFQTGWNRFMSRCIVVLMRNQDERLKRLIARGMERDDAISRIEAQKNVVFSGTIIANDGSLKSLQKSVDLLAKELTGFSTFELLFHSMLLHPVFLLVACVFVIKFLWH